MLLRKYVVKEGDTIHKVAHQFQVRVIDLLLSNHQLENASQYIYPNEQMIIPETKNAVNKKVSPYECKMEYGPSDLEEDVKFLRKYYPSLVSIQKIGNSVMGKPIYAFVVGSGKKEVFYSGGWHANEWLTSKFLMTFLKELLQYSQAGLPFFQYQVSKILEQVKLFIVPMVNPDGIELVQQGIYEEHPHFYSVLNINKYSRRFEHWSSNIRGVDLNHQWPAGWDVEAKESPQVPWPRHYSGRAPLTEPEVKAVYHLTKKNNFSYVLAFHSQGQVIYWGYKSLEPVESKAMVERLSLVSSYEPIQTADSDGGYKDWFIQETGRPGFTIEVGVGTNPLPFSAYPEIWANNSLLALEGLLL
ncbi:LysM peptidoglycan-binding domain-containing protein [Anaerobacillus alkaliphilus]|uniref:LysM peptidoglycan-binding domain-containing protein n=1 Tax=Anaerobacillus alkaliphilus TaxID=1548597 RepID=A0A4Q0VW16_9BACI|nr:M14 family metallopeptidase [Anaerobacillus alkaliphilus]RXJ03897.1 LysM peptidoglycan-binding domain-containing protein [Anaerobacillus alkaliphilus]